MRLISLMLVLVFISFTLIYYKNSVVETPTPAQGSSTGAQTQIMDKSKAVEHAEQAAEQLNQLLKEQEKRLQEIENQK